MDQPRHNTNRPRAYLSVVLTAIAVLLALLVLDGRGAREWSSEARAQVSQPDDPAASGQALVSASEQRKTMIAELRRVASRLERIESKLASGINVKVTEMPAQKQDGK